MHFTMFRSPAQQMSLVLFNPHQVDRHIIGTNGRSILWSIFEYFPAKSTKHWNTPKSRRYKQLSVLSICGRRRISRNIEYVLVSTVEKLWNFLRVYHFQFLRYILLLLHHQNFETRKEEVRKEESDNNSKGSRAQCGSDPGECLD
jgi:hypothetical protein